MNMAIGAYCVVVALLMVGWWVVAVRSGALSRADRAPVELGLHLTAELITALVLVVGGVALLADSGDDPALVGLGMLAYTVVQSPGYFLARGRRGPVAVFIVLGVCTAVALLYLASGW